MYILLILITDLALVIDHNHVTTTRTFKSVALHPHPHQVTVLVAPQAHSWLELYHRYSSEDLMNLDLAVFTQLKLAR